LKTLAVGLLLGGTRFLASIVARDDWQKWLYLGGRGAGKTRSGAEWIRAQVDAGAKRIGLIAATAADARDVMVYGPAGLLAISPPWNKPEPILSRRRVQWRNGAVAMLLPKPRRRLRQQSAPKTSNRSMAMLLRMKGHG
jgi:phage terminase large subunit-like protein